MEHSKMLFSFLRYSLPVLGFSVICLGAFLVSLGNSCQSNIELMLAYILIIVGFLLVLAGIFWSTFYGIKQKSFTHLMRRQCRQVPRHRTIHINTVDRPSFYPPTYEESITVTTWSMPVSAIPEDEGLCNIPPPLYSETASVILDETCNREELPPQYDECMQQVLTAPVLSSGEH
ncbi:transmembrane protein 252 [Protopterus annectens]|uniref:transmembrane protein 252 n=1 Tax=Protopterus annectens TaxID=7888 RepID=UPI001CFA85E6|nr:transmembrane protein 252 [Protopterus annectens]